MKAHVAAVFSATPLPCMLYNNPVAYGTDFLPEQIRELAAEHENLAAVKESSTDVRRVSAIRALLDNRLEICVGVDDAVLEAIGVGATGWIAGLANALPRESVDLFNYGIERRERKGVRVVSLVSAVAANGYRSKFRSTHQAGAGGSGDRESAGAAAAARTGRKRTRADEEDSFVTRCSPAAIRSVRYALPDREMKCRRSFVTKIAGRSLIGFREGTGAGEALYATNPTTGERLAAGIYPSHGRGS